ncbi:septation ring formation regulator EzrA [Lacticaseibacillus camelliae]|nr:septation ring formation regulator EzrA [Lacticaseibacillus camelliae]
MNWIIIVLIIIVLLALGVWGYQLRNTRLIHELDAGVATIDTGAVPGLIRSIQQLSLTGDSLEDFKSWSQKYQALVDGELTELQTALLDVEQANKQFKFGQVKDGMANIDALQTAAAKDMKQIESHLDEIKAAEAANAKGLKALRNDYQEARKTVLAKSFAFGDALPALEASLQAIASQLTTTTEVNVGGDPRRAQNALKQVKNGVAALKLQVKQLPPLVNSVVNEFPAQLKEIKTGYQQLTAQHFIFTEDVPAGVAAVQGLVDQAEAQIKQLDVTELTANTATIADKIDSLYAVMEKELKAKASVLDQKEELRQFINHAMQQNRTLNIELDHLNQSYQLNHDEIKTTNDLKVQLDAIDQSFNQANDQIAQSKAVYSDLLAQFTHDRTDLTEIEKKQQAINASVSGLRETERKALNQVDAFERSVRDVRYEVSRHDLPGLPKAYRDFFKVVSDEILQLKDDMDQVKIDLDAIAKTLIKVSADIDQLKQQSRDIIGAAGLCEQLLQYANRYKTSHEAVAKAMTDAAALYAKYDYQSAADTIATALEQVEPGSYKKVADDYNAQQHDELV